MPKTASISISHVLKKRFGAFVYPFKSKEYVNNYHDMDIPPQYKDYFVFVSIRNPYTRAYSIYRQTKQSRKELKSVKFTGFITKYLEAQPHWFWRSQSEWLKNKKINSILRFENIINDFNNLPFINKRIEIPYLNTAYQRGQGGPFPHKGPNRRLKTKIDIKPPPYNYTTKSIVARWASDDFDQFGYDREGILFF